MTDNLQSRGGQDRTRINVNQEHEVRDWAQKFGVSTERLKQAVRAVGDRVEKVKEYLMSDASRD